jgi:hypothetical protein
VTFTRTVASSGENEKTKNLQGQYFFVRKGEGKRKKTQRDFEETSESQTRKAVFPRHFCHKYLSALLVANATQCSPHPDRSPSVSGYSVSRSRLSVCVHCAGVSWRERRPPTPDPEPKTDPQLQTRTRNEPHMRPPMLPEPNSGPRQSFPNLMRA